jgi:hypothetical protein
MDRRANRIRAYRFIVELARGAVPDMLPTDSQILLSDLDALGRGLADPTEQLIAVLRSLPRSVLAPGEIDEYLVRPFVDPGS